MYAVLQFKNKIKKNNGANNDFFSTKLGSFFFVRGQLQIGVLRFLLDFDQIGIGVNFLGLSVFTENTEP